MSIEYEIKLRGDRRELDRALERAGARRRAPKTLEDDLVLDTPDRQILRAGGMLRLRSRGEQFLFTMKGPKDHREDVKARTEIETRVEDGHALRRVLEELGYVAVIRYQKYRTTFDCGAPGCGSVVLTLDETPVGDFLEVEGDPERIHDCAAALGLGRERYETRSYLEIHEAVQGGGDMVFEDLRERPWGSVDRSAGDEAP